MHSLRIVALLALLFGSIAVTNSQSIIINELFNASTTTDEWIELLVIQEGLDLRGWDLRDFSGAGAPQSPLAFSTNALWSNLRAGTIIVISAGTLTEDLDASDYTVTVRSTNSTYLTGTVFNFAGASEAVQIRNASDVHVFGVSWGPANAASLTVPRVHFPGASTSGTSVNFADGNLGVVADSSKWVFNGAANTRGAGNSTANSNWINSLRARPEGSGSASITPTVMNGSVDTTVTIAYRPDTSFAITTLQVVIPADFEWSQSLTDVSFDGMTATASISGDTIIFSDVAFTSDSAVITMQHLMSPVFTGYYRFVVRSGSGGFLGNVAPILQITVYGASVPISDTKVNDANGASLRIGDLVTVRGIVTAANEFGSPSYLQDVSGGMSVFGTTFSTAVAIGDEVLVSGRIAQFNGLNQIELPTIHSVLSSGNSIDPIVATPTQLKNDGVGGVEAYEGLLVRVNGVTVSQLNGSPVATWAANTNYRITGSSPSDTVQFRIDNNTDLVGAPAPAGTFDVIGVLGQFKTTPPFIGGYQLMPRLLADVISEGPIFAESPVESDLAPSSMTISFKTINPGTSRLRYGKTRSYELGVVAPDDSMRINHAVVMSALETATIYHVQAFSVAGSDTSFAGNLIVSTTSAPPTTGQINVYFNKTVDASLSIGETAQENTDLLQKLLQRINNARYSIDVCLYSLSGNPGAAIAGALVTAKNRGVKVRVIGEYDNRNTAPWTTLANNGIPIIRDLSGSNDGAGLHHNKFFVIDYRGGAPESVWVWTGSWNPTNPGTDDDRQNSIEIQDVALAGAYTTEFEEEWGSSTDSPNSSNARFGSRKTDNTPHHFLVNGIPVEAYFSPSDRTTGKLINAVMSSQQSINGAIYTFTRRDLSDSMVVMKNRGRMVRIVLDDTTDRNNTRYFPLVNAGVDVVLKGFSTGLLHHKYMVIDPALPSSMMGTFGVGVTTVATGSHNWSNSAENTNDENTLIIRDPRVSNLYIQEFSARYNEAGGQNPVLGVQEVAGNGLPEKYELMQNYPNPFNPVTDIRFQISEVSKTSLKIYDVLGREVAELVNESLNPGTYRIQWDASSMASGVYYYRLAAGAFMSVKKMMLVR